MSDKHSIAEARRNLPMLVRKAERGQAVELTRRGEWVAVLIGRHRYEQLVTPRPSFEHTYRVFRTQVDLAALAIDTDEIFGDTRDKSPGRASELGP